MSRHRNVRNLVAEEYYDDYYDDYDDYDDYEAAPVAPKAAKSKKKQQQQQQQAKAKKKASPAASIKSPASSKSTAKVAGASSASSLASPYLSPAATQSKSTDSVAAQHASTSDTSATPPVPAVLLKSPQQKQLKSPLTVVILGHVDAGKSTVTGHLLYAQQRQGGGSGGALYSNSGSNRNRQPINYAWLLDEDEKEREHGVTMDIATKQLTTPHFDIVLQDAPGHADYVPAMITGTASADAALLVVDATDFKTAYEDGQLKEHIYLARGLGVQQVLVAVNKMDKIDYDESMYDTIQHELKRFLTSIGYAENRIRFVPVSGLTGVNVFKEQNEEAFQWYKGGPTLLQALDGFDAPVSQQSKLLEKPVRIVLTDVLAEQGKGVAVRGKVVQGWIGSGETVVALPIGDNSTINKLSSLQVSDSASAERRQYAVAGEMIDIQLTGVDIMRLSTGSILARSGARPPLATKCRVKVWVLEGLTIPIIRGAQAIFHMHHLDVPCHLSKLIRTLKKDGSTAKERPRALTANTQAVVELTLSNAIVMEAFQDCRALGRFVLRRGGDSIAVGRIEEVLAK